MWVDTLSWLLILALLALVLVLCGLVAAALQLKSHAVINAKRLYEPPSERWKNLSNTGKGLAQQEVERARRITDRVKTAAVPVNAVVSDARIIAENLQEADVQEAAERMQEIIGLMAAFSKVVQSASRAK